jgi:LacI family transcriptional regulator
MARSSSRVDMRDSTKRAQVSTAAVSRAINRIATVNPQLAKRTWNTVGEPGCYPNAQAHAQVFGRSRIFGSIVAQITNPLFLELVQKFETVRGW